MALPNALDYYVINVDANSEWFPRNYAISVPGRPTNYSFQPYLVSALEGYLVWFYVYDISGISLPDVLVKVKKNVEGIGITEVESRATDATGIVVFSFVALDNYNLNFYYDGNIILSETFVPSLTAYYVSTAGSDANDGMFATPWLTWGKGLNDASPGDTVYFRGGVYIKDVSDGDDDLTLLL